MSTTQEALATGLEHHRAGRLLEAEHFYRKALVDNPRNAKAYHLLGLLAFQVGKHAEAADYVLTAVRIDGFHVPYLVDLAEIYRANNQIPAAIASLRHALKINSDMAGTWNDLGTLHRGQVELAEAIVCFQEALRLDPKLAVAHRNLGEALERQNQAADAQVCFEEAVRLAPGDPLNYFYLGTAFHEQGHHLEAIACYQKALDIVPNMEGPSALCAEARLSVGDFAGGWNEFEAWQRARYTGATSELPLWHGDDLAGRKLWIHGQCALGDVLQFIRYLPLVQKRGGQFTIDVPVRLLPLLEQSGVPNLLAAGTTPNDCQVQAHLMSLPMLLGTTFESMPAPPQYLLADEERVRVWKKRLASVSGFRIGIHWQGSPGYPLDRVRSMPLAEFAPLAAVPDITLVSLQKQAGREQMQAAAEKFQVMDFDADLDEQGGAFLDTAAAIMNLDLIVTSDSAVAHLAGALGRPVWVALSTAGDWRWFTDRADSPWYPSMRLFRQPTLGDWPSVFEQIATAVKPLVRAK